MEIWKKGGVILIEKLKKEMEYHLNEIRLDEESNHFSTLIYKMSKSLKLTKEEKELLRIHDLRYHTVCYKDIKLRTPKVVEKAIQFVDLKDEERKRNHLQSLNLNKKEVEILLKIDYYDIVNRYGFWAGGIYRKMNPQAQKQLLKALDNIENDTSIPENKKEYFKRKYLIDVNKKI